MDRMKPLKQLKALCFPLALGLVLSASMPGQTVALPYELVIQPISIQNSLGYQALLGNPTYVSELSLFQAATQEIFAQVGVRLVWDPFNTYVDSTNTFYTITGSDVQLAALTDTMGHGQSVKTTYSQSAVPGDVLNVWFTGPNTSVLGYSQQSTYAPLAITGNVFKNGVTVSETIFNSASYYSLTTLAHEIGHSLGLWHYTIGSSPNFTVSSTEVSIDNLMRNTGFHRVTNISEITTNGTTGYGILSPIQIQVMLSNPLIHINPNASDTYTYAIPEPADFSLIAGFLVGAYKWWRRHRRTA